MQCAEIGFHELERGATSPRAHAPSLVEIGQQGIPRRAVTRLDRDFCVRGTPSTAIGMTSSIRYVSRGSVKRGAVV